MREELTETIRHVCDELFGVEADVALTRPEEQFGDFATNIAMQLAKKLGKNPREVAQAIVDKLGVDASVAGPGFINIRVTDEHIFDAALDATNLPKPFANQVIITEYSDPNPFKILHAGHIYTTVVGDVIASLMETAGATVHRVNYGGDVGLHVARTMWAMLRRLGGEFPDKLQDIPDKERSAWMSAAYVEGNNAYTENERAKAEITALNKQVYQFHAKNDHDSPLAQIYWTCRDWSYQAFDAFYERLGTKMDRYYPESEVAESGLAAVREQIGKVFEESEGAVVFKGEPYGLHTRVFINKEGLPTYEAKEVGLILKKYDDYHFNRSIIVTADEQMHYMAVVMKAVEQFLPELVQLSTYVSHGMVKLVGGVKMSSRLGNIIPATQVIDETAKANEVENGKNDEQVTLGAIKYSFLKNRIGGDIIYDPKESVSLEGNSGPYLQYALVRARSILRKLDGIEAAPKTKELDAAERSLARQIGLYPETFTAALADYSPHHICNYLYELAVAFNRFYEQSRVIGHARTAERVSLVQAYEKTLSNGLTILGMPKPEQM